MSRLTELISRVERKDVELARELAAEVKTLTDRREFGLNFERHIPESVELPGRKVRVGDKVRLRPSYGNAKKATDRRLWIVTSVRKFDGVRTAHLLEYDAVASPASTTCAVADLFVVAEFRDPIFPGLKSTGKLERGGDKPFHTVINSENYHALEALMFAHEGKIDCIYIDPPYNTRDKDWKYNNDYVDSDDAYKHSKWLAMMERRLKLAKRLLNPDDSALIVTIDEKEVHRLGLLIKQVFSGHKSQMVAIVINHRGVARNQEFTRVEEYAFFVFIGTSGPCLTNDDLLMVAPEDSRRTENVRWERLIKGSNDARRQDRPNLFYPIYVDPERRRIVIVGDPIPPGADRAIVPDKPGLVAVWPLSMDGAEKRWQCSAETFRKLVVEGLAKVGSYDRKNDRWSILYLNRGQRERIARGEFHVTGRDENGVVEVKIDKLPLRAAMTVWNRTSHNAGYYGSGILSTLIPNRKFPYPKSLYAVEDALRFAVGNKRGALVLDFFAGSGTTAHAVFRLNRQDAGHRRSIIVTNNEVSADEAVNLRAQGHHPDDSEWKALGICEYITKPRITAAITGCTPSGNPIKGDYKFIDEFPISEGFEENVEFFDLTYEDPNHIRHDLAFAAIAPLLWMKAGNQGCRIEESSEDFNIADTYAVLFNVDASGPFLKELAESESIQYAFVVTDDESQYQLIADQLSDNIEPVRLYESYLRTFEINVGKE